MIKVFAGKWRGLGIDQDDGFGLILDFRFRNIVKHFHGAKFAVFIVLALHSDENGLCWPSYDLLEKETGYKRDTIARALNDLCELTINGSRVLMRYRERGQDGRFSGSNRYLIFPSDAEVILFEDQPESENLTLDSNQSPKIPTLENTNSGKSDSKLNQEELKKNQYLSLNAPGFSENGAGQKKGDLVDAAIYFGAKGAGKVDVGAFPEDVQPVIERFCQLYSLTPPARQKGGEFANWIEDTRFLIQAGGNLTLQALESLKDNPYEWMKIAMIARPGTLIKAVRARAGELRTQAAERNEWTPAELEAMKAKIEALKAKQLA